MTDNEIILKQVEKDVNSITDLKSIKAFIEKYDGYAKWYIQKRKILKESGIENSTDYSKCTLRESTDNNQHVDYSKYTLEELKEITKKNTSKHLLEALIMTNINDYRVTVGLPILK